jgi:hypothetical protein
MRRQREIEIDKRETEHVDGHQRRYNFEVNGEGMNQDLNLIN